MAERREHRVTSVGQVFWQHDFEGPCQNCAAPIKNGDPIKLEPLKNAPSYATFVHESCPGWVAPIGLHV